MELNEILKEAMLLLVYIEVVQSMLQETDLLTGYPQGENMEVQTFGVNLLFLTVCTNS